MIDNKKKMASSFVSFRQIVLMFYMLVSLILVFFHEPWEDELQAWCIARDLSIPGIFHQMRYEGHFVIWFFLLKPFASLGMSINILNLLSWLLSAAVAGMFLTSRNFGKTVKILILLSCPLLYWFPVVARCYALIPPALVLLAGLNPVRLKKPFAYACSLLLLVHTHAYIEGFAGILGVFFAWDLLMHCRRMAASEKWKAAGVLLLLMTGVLIAFLQVAPAFGTSSYAPDLTVLILHSASTIPSRILNVLMRLPIDFIGNSVKFIPPKVFIWLFYGMFSASIFQLFRTRGLRVCIFFLAGFFWQILFAALLYPMTLHRVYLPFLILIFCYALPIRKKRLRNIVKPMTRKILTSSIPLVVLSVMTLPDMVYYVSQDIRLPFSNQEQTAFFIRNNLPPEGKIYVFPATLITGTFRAYLPDRVFYRCSDGRPFLVFQTQSPMPEKLDDALIQKLIGNEDEIYLLFQLGAFLSYGLPNVEEYDFPSFKMNLLYVSNPLAFFSAGEVYVIFKVTRKKRNANPE